MALNFLKKCCCNLIKTCKFCCDQTTSNGNNVCCYSYKTQMGDNSNGELEIFNHRFTDDVSASEFGIPTTHTRTTAVQNGISVFHTTFGNRQVCTIDVPVYIVFEDFFDNKNNREFDDVVVINIGPVKCGGKWGNKRLWNSSKWPADFGTNSDTARCNFIDDESLKCDGLFESMDIMYTRFPAQDIREQWSMSLGLTRKVTPCEPINCATCE